MREQTLSGDTVDLLKDCDSGCRMATESMEQMLQYVKNPDLNHIIMKYNEDDVYKNSYYSQIAGVTMKELIRMENEFLSLIDFNLFIETNLFDKYKNGLVHSFFL